MLSVEGLAARYGGAQALQGVSLSVGAGEVVTLLGRNGMGKTTTLRAIMGLLPAAGGRLTAGCILLDGRPIEALAPHRIARLGLGLVPEGRQVFPTLSVTENLTATAASRGGAAPRCSPGWPNAAGSSRCTCRAASSRCWRSGGR